ncbi:hypothetical protein ACQJBY_035840 [Aegilops geniculata]
MTPKKRRGGLRRLGKLKPISVSSLGYSPWSIAEPYPPRHGLPSQRRGLTFPSPPAPSSPSRPPEPPRVAIRRPSTAVRDVARGERADWGVSEQLHHQPRITHLTSRGAATHRTAMADLHLLHPPEPDTNGGAAAAPASAAALLLPGDPAAEAAAADPPAPPYSKRRRRPSVRLGDIGAQATASDAQLPRRHRKPSSHPRPPRRSHPDDALDPGARARGPKPGQRRPRTAWIPAPHGGADGYEDEEGHHHYYDDADQSDSAAAAARAARVSGSREASVDESDGVADWGLPNGGAACYGGGGGVRAWLDGLGLSRYAPVFEIHEVDDEVLPLLTLEDLKDMGIGAVGSRRKMFAAIQKLRSGDTVS